MRSRPAPTGLYFHFLPHGVWTGLGPQLGPLGLRRVGEGMSGSPVRVWWQAGIWHGAAGVSPARNPGKTDGNHGACSSSPPSSLPAYPPQIPSSGKGLCELLPAEPTPGDPSWHPNPQRVPCTPHTHLHGAAGSGGRRPRGAESSERTLADLHRPQGLGTNSNKHDCSRNSSGQHVFDRPHLCHGRGRGDLNEQGCRRWVMGESFSHFILAAHVPHT